MPSESQRITAISFHPSAFSRTSVLLPRVRAVLLDQRRRPAQLPKALHSPPHPKHEALAPPRASPQQDLLALRRAPGKPETLQHGSRRGSARHPSTPAPQTPPFHPPRLGRVGYPLRQMGRVGEFRPSSFLVFCCCVGSLMLSHSHLFFATHLSKLRPPPISLDAQNNIAICVAMSRFMASPS
jgi:hypothetical protein